jgi:hypothetical protein
VVARKADVASAGSADGSGKGEFNLAQLDAIVERYTARGPQGEEFTVEMLRARSKEPLTRTQARIIVEKAVKAGDIVLVRTLSNRTRIYKVADNAEHHNNERPSGAGSNRRRTIV